MDALRLQQARTSITSPTTSNAGGDGNYILSEVYDGSSFNKIAQIGMVTGTSLDDGDIIFGTAKAGSTTTKMTLDEDGNLLVGKTSDVNTANGITLRPDGGARFTSAGTGAFVQLAFFRNGSAGEVGSISTTSSATSYVTSSDQRLKENIADADDAGSKIDAIQVRKFDWKADGSHQDYGMVAQELQPIAPLAVSGDADSEEMMGVDYSKLVPMMLKEIQSLRARINAIESK